jgi:DNA repair ATPase RecN
MSMMKELDTLNQEIQSATRELDQAKGKKSAMIDTLKKEFGISPDAVEKTLKKMDSQLKDLSTKIEEKFNKLKEEYEW